jgi:hypothetical protein
MKTITKTKTQLPVIHGDLFDHIGKFIHHNHNGCSIIVPHVCNNIDLFGAGFAGAVAKHYPIVKSNYHLLGKKQVLGYTQFVTVETNKEYGHKLIFANMIAQNGVISHNNPRPLNYGALVRSMMLVNQFIQQNFDATNPVQIHAPKFGCGLAGGDWGFISDLIKDIWNNIPLFVYSYK